MEEDYRIMLNRPQINWSRDRQIIRNLLPMTDTKDPETIPASAHPLLSDSVAEQ